MNRLFKIVTVSSLIATISLAQGGEKATEVVDNGDASGQPTVGGDTNDVDPDDLATTTEDPLN